MTAMRITVSQHVQNDRADRLTYILSHPDLCDFTPAVEQIHPNKVECITVDGVMLVKSLDRSFLITAYVVTIDKALAVYKSQGLALPKYLDRKIKQNEKKHIKNKNYA